MGLFRLVHLIFALSAPELMSCIMTLHDLPLPPCAAVEVLVKELGVLLKMLDQENLSMSTQEKKTSVRNLLQQIQTSGRRGEDTDKWGQ